MVRRVSFKIYHSSLRILSLVFLTILIFDSGFIDPISQSISEQTQHYVANVIGISASVQPNDINLWTATLTEKEQELKNREAALRDREVSAGLNTSESSNSDVSVYIISVILFIILVLLILNYALDLARDRRQLFLLNQNEQKT